MLVRDAGYMRYIFEKYAAPFTTIYALKYAENVRINALKKRINALKKQLYAPKYANTPVLCGEKICGAYTKNT